MQYILNLRMYYKYFVGCKVNILCCLISSLTSTSLDCLSVLVDTYALRESRTILRKHKKKHTGCYHKSFHSNKHNKRILASSRLCSKKKVLHWLSAPTIPTHHKILYDDKSTCVERRYPYLHLCFTQLVYLLTLEMQLSVERFLVLRDL